ncbi:MAG: hypothetical protein NZ709_04335 [Candidatus Marinimicrobia bacterium]|nr:hypothetical protein [Candidatus Neomarinimicrobiota bacterium]
MKISPTKNVFEQVDRHIILAQELLKAECAMKSISLNLSIIRFANHGKFKKETLKNTERLYSEIRTLRESIGNEFQKLFEGQEKYDTARLHYAYSGNTIKEIDELFNDVSLCVQLEMECGDSSMECGDSSQDIIPF